MKEGRQPVMFGMICEIGATLWDIVELRKSRSDCLGSWWCSSRPPPAKGPGGHLPQRHQQQMLLPQQVVRLLLLLLWLM